MSGAAALDAVLAELRARGSARHREGQASFGIETRRAFGVSVPGIRAVARLHRGDHALALALWDSGWHEARILAAMIADPARAGSALLDRWAGDLESWDVTDGFANELVRRTALAWDKAVAWPADDREFVRRAGFALQACLAVHDKAADDARFEALLPLIAAHAGDERNFVKKAVNWSLRQIGKRNPRLNASAVTAAEALTARESAAARWIGRDALRELTSEKVQARLAARA